MDQGRATSAISSNVNELLYATGPRQVEMDTPRSQASYRVNFVKARNSVRAPIDYDFSVYAETNERRQMQTLTQTEYHGETVAEERAHKERMNFCAAATVSWTF